MDWKMTGSLFDENKIVKIYKRNSDQFGFGHSENPNHHKEVVMECKSKYITTIIKSEKKIPTQHLDSIMLSVDRGYQEINSLTNEPTGEWTFYYTSLSSSMMGGGRVEVSDFPTKLREIKLKEINGTED